MTAAAALIDFSETSETRDGEEWIGPEHDHAELTERITAVPLGRPLPGWLLAAGLAFALALVMLAAIGWLLWRGIGVWGVNVPVGWGFAITNFVWWIGIGHAGTLISAVLFLVRQRWRTSINRFAEAMTLFAIAMAGIFPLLHLGRPSFFYYLVPYPSSLEVWPQWRSPLVWDLFAVATYGVLSLCFWYLGALPDLAAARDAAKKRWQRRAYGVCALGWRGAAAHWQRQQALYLLLAGAATPLVVSVHSIVALDFAVSVLPGWHATVFPPYFVAGAIFSGMAMVLTLAVPVRAAYRFRDLITVRHLDVMAKVMLAAGLVVALGYVSEYFTAWYSGEKAHIAHLRHMFLGEYSRETALMLACNVAVPQLLWFRRVRTAPLVLFTVAVLVNVGMWTERLLIVVTPLFRDFVPSSWGHYAPTVWDWLLFVGSLGAFLLLFALFLRLVPMLSIAELRELLHEEHGERAATAAEAPAEAGAREVAEADLHGVAAEFGRASALLAAARGVRAAGYARVEAYAPWPVAGLSEALGRGRTRMSAVVLAGALGGAAFGYLLQWYSAAVDYPWNVAGRPPHSWPSFVPLTFELGVLGATLAGFGGFLALCGLPRPYHPIMNAPGFERVSRDGFLLCIERMDPRFERERVAELLVRLGATRVSEVRR